MEKIFGFALSKTMNTDKAEELASRITFDVYMSLLKIDSVHNIDGYVYRVAHNVYARFVDEEARGRRVYVSLNDLNLPCGKDFSDDFEKDEICIRLRNEISYLGKIRREIVVMHYFQRLKEREIAARLNLPLGTVKWHLHDAKNQIKESLMNEKRTLAMSPVKLNNITFSGEPGARGEEPKDYLAKLISQNVAYAAYHEAKTITEIAEALGVPAAFVEDEVEYLEDNGFMDKAPGGKYLTNIFIAVLPNDARERITKVYVKNVKVICEKYVPLIFDAMADFKQKSIYSPGDDFNFLMWAAITWACGQKLRVANEWVNLPKYWVKHKDGGNYITNAIIHHDALAKNEKAVYEKIEYSCSCKDKYPIDAWQFGSCFDDRPYEWKDYLTMNIGWKDSLSMDYEYLYEYMTGKIAKDPVHADKFKRLFDKSYLVTKGDSEYVNIIVTTLSQDDFTDTLPAVPDEIKAVCEEADKEVFAIVKAHYPPHMQDLCRIRHSDCLARNDNRVRVLEQLAASGALKPLTSAQKLSVNTIMFCNVLPNE